MAQPPAQAPPPRQSLRILTRNQEQASHQQDTVALGDQQQGSSQSTDESLSDEEQTDHPVWNILSLEPETLEGLCLDSTIRLSNSSKLYDNDAYRNPSDDGICFYKNNTRHILGIGTRLERAHHIPQSPRSLLSKGGKMVSTHRSVSIPNSTSLLPHFSIVSFSSKSNSHSMSLDCFGL
ncbi:unnamed protein product [Sympodiomycopsis kandeliae]